MDRLVFPSYATNRTRTRPESDHSAGLSLCYLLCYILLPAALSGSERLASIMTLLFILHSVQRQEARRRAWPLLGPEIRRLNRSQARATLGAVTNGQKGAAANWSRGFLTGDATQ